MTYVGMGGIVNVGLGIHVGYGCADEDELVDNMRLHN